MRYLRRKGKDVAQVFVTLSAETASIVGGICERSRRQLGPWRADRAFAMSATHKSVLCFIERFRRALPVVLCRLS